MSKYTKDLVQGLLNELPDMADLLRISWENPDCVTVDLRFVFSENHFEQIKQSVIREY
jgi:hypothetical protein